MKKTTIVQEKYIFIISQLKKYLKKILNKYACKIKSHERINKMYEFIKSKLNLNEEEVQKVKDNVKSKTLDAIDGAQEVIVDGTNYTKDKVKNIIDEYKSTNESTSLDNWYGTAAKSCEDITDSILGEDKGTSRKITKAFAAKLGAVGTSVGIFSIASLIGTASTGTAISSLSGAAFTSASLAWLGGSVAMGSIMIGAVSIAGGIGAVLGAGWVFKKYVYGEKREKSELELKEQNIIDVCISLATAFRQEAKSGKAIDPIVAKALYVDALQPLCEDLLEYKTKTESLPYLVKERFESALSSLQDVTNYLKVLSEKNPNTSIGIISAVVLQLLSNDVSSFNENETLVLEALRRTKSTLVNANNEELAEYVQLLEPEKLWGLQNNIKGIYHEFRFVDRENSDGDEYVAEIFEATNHPGADVIITNTITGDAKEIQLKATDYLSYVKKHNERYEDIEVFATSEVASQDPNISDSGFSNDELADDVDEVICSLPADTDFATVVGSSMAVAAMVTLAKNAKVLLRGERMSTEEKREIIEGGTTSAGVAGMVSLLIG